MTRTEYILRNGCFITGTDTGVGKTVVSAIFSSGAKIPYWKPVQTGAGAETGADVQSFNQSDADFIRSFLPAETVISEVYSLRAPLSPHLAAELESQTISLEKIVNVYKSLPKPLIVEGAGGLLVPLNKKDFMVDLIAALDLPVVLVARTGLGTINHTLMSLQTIAERKLKLAGIVLVGDEHSCPDHTFDDFLPLYLQKQFKESCVLGRIPITSEISKSWLQTSYLNVFRSKNDPSNFKRIASAYN